MVRQAVVFAGFFLLTFLFMQLSLHPSGGTRRGGHRQQQNIYSPSTSGSEPTSQALTEPPVIDHSKISVVNGDMSRNLVRLDTSATNLDPLPGKVEAQRRPYPADVREKYESAMKCPGAPSGRCDETTFTIFAAPKPMSRPHIALIQRNAVRSWLNLVPKPKVIIFGEGEGLAEFAAAEGIKHVRDVNMLRFKHETMPSLGPLFRSASEHAVTKTLVFTNADILFPQAFADALMTCNNASDAFLMMVPRNRIQLTWDINFTDPEWDVRLFHHCDLVSPNCKTDSYRALDTFSYTRATYHAVEIPPFAIGRPAYDNFLIHAAVWNRVPLVGTHTLLRVWHQNHDYTHINDKSSNSSAVNGWSPTLWSGEGSAYNRRILNDRGNRAFETDGSQLQATFMIETQTKGCPTVPYRFGNCRLRLKRYANKLSVGFHPIPLAETVRVPPIFCLNTSICDPDDPATPAAFRDDRHVVPEPIAPALRLPRWFEIAPAFTPADDVSVPPISFFAAGSVKDKPKGSAGGNVAKSNATAAGAKGAHKGSDGAKRAARRPAGGAAHGTKGARGGGGPNDAADTSNPPTRERGEDGESIGAPPRGTGAIPVAE